MTEQFNSSAQAALHAALAKAQGGFLAIAKNRSVMIRMKEGGTYKFDYADLESIIRATRPALATNGLAVVQSVGGDGPLWLDTVLVHSAGGSLISRLPITVGMNDPKAFGSTLSYLRRYAYSALLCVAADDDLDANSDPANDPPKVDKPRPVASKPAPESALKAQAMASPGEMAWLTKKITAVDPALVRELLDHHRVQLAGEPLTQAAFAALKTDLMKA